MIVACRCERARLALGWIIFILWTAGLPAAERADEAVVAARVRKQFAELAERGARASRPVIGAGPGWLFLTADLRFSALGPFWGEKAREVSRSRKVEHADPLAAIVDFHRQLAERQIELWVVPVPPKPAVELAAWNDPPVERPWPRCDGAVQGFLAELSRQGVAVVDLEPVYRERCGQEAESLYLKADSHWSGAGVVCAAAEIGARLRERPWWKDLAHAEFERSAREIEILGDLKTLPIESVGGFETAMIPKKEPTTLWYVHPPGSDRPVPLATSSPVLLLGDSHTLVFHDPTLHAAGGGLPDQLAYELGFPVDLIGVRGSGSTAARVSLARDKDRLAGKRAVIWCFAAREFTESVDGWRVLPLGKP